MISGVVGPTYCSSNLSFAGGVRAPLYPADRRGLLLPWDTPKSQARADVRREAVGTCEGLAACVAPMRLFARMLAEVPRKGAGRCEGVAAGVTREVLLSRMRSNVLGVFCSATGTPLFATLSQPTLLEVPLCVTLYPLLRKSIRPVRHSS